MKTLTPKALMPYPGLRPFEFEDRNIFFGRETQVADILRLMEDNRFLAVVGSSGCGKSSLVRAGLVPALYDGFLMGCEDWHILIIKPGHEPYQRLADNLLRLSDPSPDLPASKPEQIANTEVFKTLRKTEHGLLDVLSQITPVKPILIIIDQFEELFAFRSKNSDSQLVASRDEAAAFVNMLLHTCQNRKEKIWVMLTMRSDFIGNCEAFLGLPEAVSRSQYLVPRLNRNQLAEAIRRPGEVTGEGYENFSFQEDLVNRIINDAGDRPDQLPLMQHALMRTWKGALQRVGKTDVAIQLTHDDYRQGGGIAQAISLHAEKAWGKIKENPIKANIARRLFLLLCDVSAEGQITRRCAQIGEIKNITGANITEIEQIITLFQADDRNFLLLKPPIEDDTYLDISHESLIRQWTTLNDWVFQEIQAVDEYRALCRDARKWQLGDGELLQNKDLASTEKWWEREQPNAEWANRYGSSEDFALAEDYIKASRDKAEQDQVEEENKRNSKLRRARKTAYVFALTVLLLLAGIIAYYLAYIRDYDLYFNSFVKLKGVPHGIGRLTDDQVKHRALSYKITRQGRRGQVNALQGVDAHLQPTEVVEDFNAFDPSSNQSMTEQSKASRLEYYYDAKGNLAHEVSINRYGDRVGNITYAPFNSLKNEERMAYRIGRYGSLASKQGSCYANVKYVYDNQGHEIEYHYLDETGKPTPGRDNAYIMQKQYDGRGNLTAVRSLYKDRTLMNDQAGNAIFKMTYDHKANMTSSSSYDAGETMMADKESGVVITRNNYDDFGRIINTAYFDEYNKPLNHLNDGYHRINYSYGDSGNIKKQSYWLADGQPGENSSQCHALIYRYNENSTIETCLDSAEKLKLRKEGYASIKLKRDERNREIETAYLDEHQKPGKWLMERYQYDNNDNMIETAYFDSDGRKVENNKGYHKEINTYTANLKTQTEYFDSHGKRVSDKNTASRITYEYDTQGNLNKTSYYNIYNEPLNPTGQINSTGQNFANDLFRYDACGRKIEKRFNVDNDELMAIVDKYIGFTIIRYSYDQDNHIKEESYFDHYERPVRHPKYGYSRVEVSKNKHNQLIDRRYYDEKLKPIKLKNGLSEEYKASYDDHNGMLSKSYYDENGKPMLYNGYSQVKYINDTHGRHIAQAYFGKNNEPVFKLDENRKPLYHRSKIQRDKYGKKLTEEFYDTRGKLIKIVPDNPK